MRGLQAVPLATEKYEGNRPTRRGTALTRWHLKVQLMKTTQALLVWVTVVLSSESLFISWTPHPDNRWLTVAYNCGPKFQAFNLFDIDADMSSLRAHLVELPQDQQCSIQIDIVQGEPGSIFAEGNVSESISVSTH